jgi:prephenate dehydrogenase
LRVGIVGLGLIGGSFAKTLKKYDLASEIIGYDHNEDHQEEAMKLGIVDSIAKNTRELLGLDLIVLAIPVDAIISFLPNLVNIADDSVIMDFGSTKELISKAIPEKIRKNFILAHPMAGKEKFGPSAAVDDLYESMVVVLCDTHLNNPKALNKVETIFSTIDMRIVKMDAHEHDIHACYMSHLPHAISFALANCVMNHEDPKSIVALAAGGFRDMSRIAKSSPNMWSDIFKQNRENMLESIGIYESQIKKIKSFIENEDYDQMKEWMKKANRLHELI